MPARKRKFDEIATKSVKEKSRKNDKRKNGSDKKTENLSKATDKVKSKSDVTATEKAKSGSDVKFCHWLMKSEPDSRLEKGIDMKFGIEDLKSCPDQTSCWDGVRNYQARNFMRDQMKLGHQVFFYHSNTKQPGIVGVCEVVKESYADHTQFDTKDVHYDSSAKKDNPRWYMVDVKYTRMLKRYIPLSELKQLHIEHKANGGPLKDIALFTKARLSVQPVTQEEWDFIVSLEDEG